MLIPHYSEHEKSSIEGIIDAFNDRVYIMQRDTEDIKFIKNQNVFFHSNFKESKDYKVTDSKIMYKRIQIETKYPNGKKGNLIIETPLLFSFGVNEKKNQETNRLVG